MIQKVNWYPRSAAAAPTPTASATASATAAGCHSVGRVIVSPATIATALHAATARPQ